MPKITHVRITLISESTSRLVAYAVVTLDDCYRIGGIRLIKGDREDPNRFFLKMPRFGLNICPNCSGMGPVPQRNKWVGDVAYPINTESRDELLSAIVDAYLKQLSPPSYYSNQTMQMATTA